MKYTFTQLSASDLDRLKELLAVFGDAFNEVDTYLGAVPTDEYLRRLLSKPHFIVVVATIGGRVVGGLAAYELEKFEQERREIYIYDLAVSEEHRRRGVATGLIAQLQEVAAARGAYVIYVQADYGDDAAIRLYGSLGTKEEVLHFDLPVRQGRSGNPASPVRD
jgi:aminoglycoside 3-N-acetyltransferase I